MAELLEHPMSDLQDGHEIWFILPLWAYWLGLFAIAGAAYAIVHAQRPSEKPE